MLYRPVKGKAAPRRIQSIEVGFRLIRVLETADGPLPLKDIAMGAGMRPGSAHLYLASFAREGIVQQDALTGHYGLGPAAVRLGLSAIRQMDLVDMAREELEVLRRTTACAAYLSVWGNRGPVIISALNGSNQGALAVKLGFVLPVLNSATGQTFLAYLPEDQTAETVAAELRSAGAELKSAMPTDIVRRVRELGFAASEGRLSEDFSALSAPVFDYGGTIVATLTILGAGRMLTGLSRKETLPLLLAASRRLSAKLGARPHLAGVAGNQEHEVRYEAKKTGEPKTAGKEAVKRVGNSRSKVEKKLSK